MDKLKAALISNGIEGLERLFVSNDAVEYDFLKVTKDFRPDLMGYDILIAPNGTDNIAMGRIKDMVKAFLDQGGTLFCFDGWFTDWIPGNQWVMDNTQKTIDVRYKVKDDPFGLSRQFSIEDLNFNYGISGWWSCGYIDAAPGAHVLIEDIWQRPLVVIDDSSTNGLMVLTASGPTADVAFGGESTRPEYQAMADLYRSFLHLVKTQRQAVS